MSHHDDQQGKDHPEGGTVSEGGSGTLNADAALGGADAVPDTPDINDTGEADGIDISEQSQEDGER
jgi:hypothetical protein